MWTEINWEPGVYKDDSPLKAEGFFIDADRIRFVRGLPQTFAGHEKFSTTSFLGVCRCLKPWADFDGTKYLFAGTHLRAYAYDLAGAPTDITPVVERGELTNPFDTTDTDATVTVNDTAHGLVVDQKVKFSNASAVGGITIDGEYVVTTVATDSYTIEHSSAATSTVSGGGGTVDFEYFLAPGQLDGITGLGWSVGGWSVGGWSTPASGYVLYPRTYSAAPWGQNIIFAPRGGTIYEWAPNTTASELVTNGGFSTGAGGWTAGTGYSVGGGVANFVAGSGSDLTQTITLKQNAWHILDCDFTIGAGTVQPYVGNTTVGAAVAATGTIKRVFYENAGGSKVLKFTKDASAAGNLDNVSVKVLTTAHAVTGAPSSTYYIFVTAEGICMALGAPDSNSNFDPMLAAWSDTWGGGGSNDFSALQTWTSTNANAAGDKRLSNGTRLVAGCAASGFNLIWSDTALYIAQFSPNPSVVYRFTEVANSAGLIGPNAFTLQDGVAKWMAPDGSYYAFAGGVVTQLANTCRLDVFDNLAKVQGDKVYASEISSWGDDIWFYPDQRDGNECSRYIMMNPGNHWAPGTFDRSAFVDAGVFNWPLAADTSGNIWYHEKGDSEDGGPIAWHLEGAYYIGAGDYHTTVNGIRPDVADLKGGYCVTLKGRVLNARGIFERTVGPLDITAATGQRSFRLTAGDINIKWSGNDAPTFWRMGQNRFDIIPTRRTR